MIKATNFRKHNILAMAISTILTTGITGNVFAEEESQNKANELDQIIVVVTKKPENLQDVSVAVSAFSDQALNDAGIKSVQDLDGLVPNVRIGTFGGVRNTPITIRGIVSDANSPGIEQGVGVYIDGVYMGRPTTINSPLYDLERIEVLRGPQGTLYGKNTIAGAINIISKLPTDETEIELVAGFGNYSAVNLFASASGAVSEKLNMRVSATQITRDGFLENSQGPDNADADSVAIHFTGVYSANEDLEYIFRADAVKDRTHTGTNSIMANGIVNQMLGYQAPENPFDRKVDDKPSAFQNRDVWGASLEVNWNSDSGVFTSITAYRGYDFENFQSFDGSAINYGVSGIAEEQSQFSQEFRFSGEVSDALSYTAGIYYFNQDLDTKPERFQNEGAGLFYSLLSALGAFDADFGGLQVLDATAGPGDFITADLTDESYALFGQFDYKINEQLSLTAGLRYTAENKEISYTRSSQMISEFLVDWTPIGGVITPFPIPVSTSEADDDFSENETSGSISLNYDVSDNVLLYGSFSRGYKAGGYNAFNLLQQDGSIAKFDPETVDSFEIGYKSMLMDNRVRLNLAMYFLDYENLQVNQKVLPDDGGLAVFVVSNAATAESKGAEVEMQALLTDNLQLHLALGYNDSGYNDFTNATPAGDDFSNNRMAFAPESNAGIALQHNLELSEGWDLQSRIEVKYRDKFFSDAENAPELAQEGYSLTNLRFSVINELSGIEVTLWGRNILDEEYTTNQSYTDKSFFPGHITGNLGHPATYGIEARFRF